MKVALHGATGRMGLAIARLAPESDAVIVGAIASAGSKALGRDIGELAGVGTAGCVVDADVGAGLLGAEVVIDFSKASAVPRLIQSAMRAKVPIVSGTTRLDPETEKLLDLAAKVVPVLWAPNTSIGVHVLAEALKLALTKLGPGYDVEIVETHHRAKVDSPSGTALRLVAAAREARPDLLEEVRGRDGDTGPRAGDQIGVLAVRGGDVIGDHSVHLLGQGERLELVHRATNRDLFARGALRAARFVIGKPPGRYAMADVLA